MKKDRLISYMSEYFFKGQNNYRGNNFDTEVLKRNIGKEVPLSLAEWNEYDNKYYWSQLMITPVRVLDYDRRPEFQIPDNEKSFSKKYNKLVPNRWLWEIKPL
tara:strand:- start:12 stop:320 length:309 start_codon:yes stop_codon:yes gene_type:complete